jgi:hypothetical protein
LACACHISHCKKSEQYPERGASRATDASKPSRRESEHTCGLREFAQGKGIAF